MEELKSIILLAVLILFVSCADEKEKVEAAERKYRYDTLRPVSFATSGMV
jgi:hypothetical protein